MRVVIPGLAEAVAKEQSLRDGAFVDVPALAGGIILEPLTIRRLLILETCGDPFTCGGKVSAGDVARFLWVCSPGFTTTDRKKRDAFIKACAKMDAVETVKEIRAHVERAFFDAPQGGSADAGQSTTSFAASLVDVFASEYGWAEEAILDLPLPRAFQYLRKIQKRHDPKGLQSNPLSDRVKGDFLRGLNAKANEKN